MAEIEADLAALEGQIAELEGVMASTSAVSAAFKSELVLMQGELLRAGRQVDGMSRSIGYGLRRAFDGLVFDGGRLSDALKTLGQTMANRVLTEALKPVQNTLGGLISGLVPFQAGAGSIGAVGVRAIGGMAPPAGAATVGTAGFGQAAGGRVVQVNMHIQSPDVEGFRRSSSQIAAQMARALGRGGRNA